MERSRCGCRFLWQRRRGAVFGRRLSRGWLLIGPTEWPAYRLLGLAVDWLRERHPDAVIVPEFSMGAWGRGSVDVAAITFDKIVGVEIKGDGDSPARLRMQGLQYGMVVQEMFLLPAPSVRKRCLDQKPEGWGRLDLDVEAATLSHEGSFCAVSEQNSVRQMLDGIWAEELREVCAILGFQWWRNKKDHTVNFVSERAAIRDVRPVFVHIMRTRDWSKFGKRFYGDLCLDREYRPPVQERLVMP